MWLLATVRVHPAAIQVCASLTRAVAPAPRLLPLASPVRSLLARLGNPSEFLPESDPSGLPEADRSLDVRSDLASRRRQRPAAARSSPGRWSLAVLASLRAAPTEFSPVRD